MKRNLRLTTAAALVVSGGILLSGCDGTSGQFANERSVHLPNGETVMCIVTSDGGVDCDWENAR